MTDPKTLARTENPQTSKDAAEKMVKSEELSRQEDEVLYMIWTVRKSDFTTKEIAKRMLGYPYHKAYDICRKRFSGLRDKGKIKRVQYRENTSPETFVLHYSKRDGCCVWKLVKKKESEENYDN